MKGRLLDLRMQDGSRHFAELPEASSWDALRRHLALLPGAEVTYFLTGGVSEMWLDFTFRGDAFSVNNQPGGYWFFVKDPACPDAALTAVVDYCEQLLDP